MAETRDHIIDAAAAAMHRYGFRGMRPDHVIGSLGLTKGSLYYHFPRGKKSLGYAVLDERISPAYLQQWEKPAGDPRHPVDFLQARLQEHLDRADADGIALGCPLNNLIQEMAPLDEGFASRLRIVAGGMIERVAGLLEEGQRQRQIRTEVEPQRDATGLIAGLEGAYSIAKACHSLERFRMAMRGLQQQTEHWRMDS